MFGWSLEVKNHTSSRDYMLGWSQEGVQYHTSSRDTIIQYKAGASPGTNRDIICQVGTRKFKIIHQVEIICQVGYIQYRNHNILGWSAGKNIDIVCQVGAQKFKIIHLVGRDFMLGWSKGVQYHTSKRDIITFQSPGKNRDIMFSVGARGTNRDIICQIGAREFKIIHKVQISYIGLEPGGQISYI